MEVFSTEDLENLHSQLSLLMSRIKDRADDAGIQERFRLLPETQRLKTRVNDLYNIREYRTNKRRSGKTVPDECVEVQRCFAYIFDVLTQIEENNVTATCKMVNLDNIQDVIEVSNDQDYFKLADHFLLFTHPLAPAPISSVHLPLGNIAKYVESDIANLKSWLSDKKETKCGCKSGCATKSCHCRAKKIECTFACDCNRLICTNTPVQIEQTTDEQSSEQMEEEEEEMEDEEEEEEKEEREQT